MAPTCYNTTMKNLHYRTQSLPESVYQHQMLHLTQHGAGADYHHSLHGHHGLGNPLVSHHQAHIKKRNALRRSQTSVCDLLQSSLAHHRPSPLTAGLYEQFLPPPNFNAIGLPVSRTGHRVSRAQSFYVPGSQAGHHYSMARHEAQAQAAHHYNNSVYSCDQAQAASWYRGSVPNLPQSSYPAPAPPQKNVTTPLFVDCSVEYDLGEQPVIPKDSEPLLTIHPEYVNKCRSVPASPYTRPKPIIESHKSLPDIGDKSQAKLLARHMRSSPRAAARFAMNTQKQAEEAGRKLSVESRDSGIGGMTGGWGSSVSMYPGCDMNMITPSSAPFMTSGYPAQTSEFCGGKVLPTSASKRFALSGINPNNNSGAVSSHSSAATNNLTPAANHYQNLRIYYQLAF